MCTTCGCGESEVRIEGHEHGHLNHAHDHRIGADLESGSGHTSGTEQTRRLKMEQDILAVNNGYAAQNRRYFMQHGIFALNLVSSPGSGKTTLLTETLAALKNKLNVAVIEGDQQTSRDAERIRATGVSATQINTGKGCHLDAHMIGHAIEPLGLVDDTLLFIENVGNLVCPAAFDLGENHKVAILSVTEGEDKPLKYPDMFHAADLMLLNKIDLLPYVAFDVARCIEYARRVNPDILVYQVSATRGDGMADWLTWVQQGLQTAIRCKSSTTDSQTRNNAEFDTAAS